MMEYNREKIARFKKKSSKNRLNKLSWTITSNRECIIAGLLPFSPGNLRTKSLLANKALHAFYETEGHPKMGDILIIDFFESSKFMELVFLMNGITAGYDYP
jgi:hypothetical protein